MTSDTVSLNMLDLGQEISNHLGPNFKAYPYKPGPEILTHCVRLVGEETLQLEVYSPGILLSHDSREHKISIRGLYPKARDGREFPSAREQIDPIRVKDTKKPYLIARDIQNRFLPDYQPVFTQAVRDAHGHNVYLNKRDSMAREFAALIHGQVLPSGDRIEGGPLISSEMDKRGYLHDLYINASDNTVSLTLHSVPAHIATSLLEVWLSGWIRECRDCHTALGPGDTCLNPNCRRYHKNGFETL